jgi:hypothetical protein
MSTNGSTAQFEPKPAVRENITVFVGIAGGTGSGKTFSGLTLARGMVGPSGRILVGDTEGRRALYYADQFKFDHVELKPPFRPQVFEDLAKYAEEKGYDALVIDSMSHEWAGDGGVLEWHDEELDRAVAVAMQRSRENEVIDEERVRNANNMRGWIKPKAAHKAMVNSFLQRTIPIIFCFRAEEKVKVLPNGKIEPMGWTPIGDSRFMYELTTLLTLANDAAGEVNYKLPNKLNAQHKPFFRDGVLINEDAGRLLKEWAKGGAPAKTAEKQKATEPEMKAHTGKKKLSAEEAEAKVKDGVEKLIARMAKGESVLAVDAMLQEPDVQKQVAFLLKNAKGYHKHLIDEANRIRRELRVKGKTGDAKQGTMLS